jgi:hypothetical protein
MVAIDLNDHSNFPTAWSVDSAETTSPIDASYRVAELAPAMPPWIRSVRVSNRLGPALEQLERSTGNSRRSRWVQLRKQFTRGPLALDTNPAFKRRRCVSSLLAQRGGRKGHRLTARGVVACRRGDCNH